MTYIEKELGRCLTADDLSRIFGIDKDSIRRHYKAFGGIRPTGPSGRILFFERNVVDALRSAHALEDPEKWPSQMERKSSEERDHPAKTVRHQGGSLGVGSRGEEKGLEQGDRHGLFPAAVGGKVSGSRGKIQSQDL